MSMLYIHSNIGFGDVRFREKSRLVLYKCLYSESFNGIWKRFEKTIQSFTFSLIITGECPNVTVCYKHKQTFFQHENSKISKTYGHSPVVPQTLRNVILELQTPLPISFDHFCTIKRMGLLGCHTLLPPTVTYQVSTFLLFRLCDTIDGICHLSKYITCLLYEL